MAILITNKAGSGSGGTFKAPTVQIFTSGSGTYTPPSGPSPLYIQVEMVGGGGGGSGSSSIGIADPGPGGDGTDSTFGSFLTAGHGFGSTESGGVTIGGAGGTYSLSTPAINIGSFNGGSGNSGGTIVTGESGTSGGGMATPFGGAGGAGPIQGNGMDAVPNTGSGGGGGGGNNSASGQFTGAGGGPSSYVKAIIPSPVSSQSYVVGTAGTAGTAGDNGFAGGAGGSGIIIITEFYQ